MQYYTAKQRYRDLVQDFENYFSVSNLASYGNEPANLNKQHLRDATPLELLTITYGYQDQLDLVYKLLNRAGETGNMPLASELHKERETLESKLKLLRAKFILPMLITHSSKETRLPYFEELNLNETDLAIRIRIVAQREGARHKQLPWLNN
ncbi:hypothetical protein J4227_07670 [Candidatus Woesearchaeota archaeon]|nr:hypothetical protein [Candidatus Woesearchaeota archaeon]